MYKSVISAIPTLNIWQRMLIAFAIGAPTTLLYSFNFYPTPIWWQPEIPALVYLAALIIAVASHRRVQSGEIEGKRLTTVLLILVTMVFAFFVLEMFLLRPQNPFYLSVIGYVLVPVVVGMTAAFAIGSHRSKGYAQWLGFIAWLGAAVVNMIAVVMDYLAFQQTSDYQTVVQKAGTGDGGVIILMTLLAHFSALAIAAFAGEWGRRLHRKLLGITEEEELQARQQAAAQK